MNSSDRWCVSRGFTVILVLVSLAVHGGDWPQWMGPDRDSVWEEDGVIDTIPDSGLKVQWRVPTGLGYGGPAVADGRVYVLDYDKQSGAIRNNPGSRVLLTGKERVRCLDVKDGSVIWQHAYERPYNLSYPGGPRCTPTVDGNQVFALGAEGDLTCLEAATGKVLWTKNFEREYDVRTPIWGHSAHPLVVGDTVYCVVGGDGSVAVAFDRNTGDERWRALSASEPGYCPPTMIHHGDADQLLIWHPESLNSLNPRTGKVYWSIPLKPGYGMSIAAPRKSGGALFATAIGNVAALIELDASQPDAEVIWRGTPKTALYSVNATPIIDGDMIYGCDVETSALMGVRLRDGERVWQTKAPTIGEAQGGRHGTAFLVRHDDRYFLFSETGDLILAELSEGGYRELGRFHVLDPTNEVFGRACVWSHPAFAERSVFARNDKELVRVSLAAEDY